MCLAALGSWTLKRGSIEIKIKPKKTEQPTVQPLKVYFCLQKGCKDEPCNHSEQHKVPYSPHREELASLPSWGGTAERPCNSAESAALLAATVNAQKEPPPGPHPHKLDFPLGGEIGLELVCGADNRHRATSRARIRAPLGPRTGQESPNVGFSIVFGLGVGVPFWVLRRCCAPSPRSQSRPRECRKN